MASGTSVPKRRQKMEQETSTNKCPVQNDARGGTPFTRGNDTGWSLDAYGGEITRIKR